MRRPAWLADPAAPSLSLFAATIVAGFVAIALGWRVAAGTLLVYRQIPAFVSGGLAGVSLVLIGSALASVQVGRRAAAVERADTEALLTAATEMLAAARHRGGDR